MNNLRLTHNVSYTFTKVKGHSNIEGNKKADKLAARARNFNAYVDIDAILKGIVTVKDIHFFKIG
jgi:ribonuclease HI